MIDFNDTQFELEEENFITNDTSITYANAWDFIPGYQLPQNFQCGGVDNVGMFLCVANDGYVRLTAVEPGTGVPQEYVDRQDQAVLEEATQRLEEGAGQLTQLINQEANTREQEDIRLSNLIDNLDATKAGTNYVQVSSTGSSTNQVSYITIGEDEYKLAGGGGGTSVVPSQQAVEGAKTIGSLKIDGTDWNAPSTANFVDLTSAQEISGGKNFTGYLTQNNDPVATASMLSTYATLSQLDEERDIRSERDAGLLDDINQLNDRVVDIERQEDTWNAKSVVSGSGTGTSTDIINYITINGTEYMFGAVTGDVTKAYVDEQDTTLRNSINTKQNINDNSLATTSKTIVGAINELNTKFNTELLEGNDCIELVDGVSMFSPATYTYSMGRLLYINLQISTIPYSLIQGHEPLDRVVIGHLKTTKIIKQNTSFTSFVRINAGNGLNVPCVIEVLGSNSYDPNAVQLLIRPEILETTGDLKSTYLNCHTLLKEN